MEQIERPSFIIASELPDRLEPIYADDLRINLREQFEMALSSDGSLNKNSVLHEWKNNLDSKDNLQVFLRIRPMTSAERKQNGAQDCVTVEDSTNVLLKAPSVSLAGRVSDKMCTQSVQRFTFSHIFGPETTQEEFFEVTVKELVSDFLDGRNRLLFTYGVTNAGKTYTFQGTPDHPGILPRSMNMLFKSLHNKQYTKMDLKPHRCREYVRLSKDQVKKEMANKNALLRHTKEIEPHGSAQAGLCLESVDSIEGHFQSSVNSQPCVAEQARGSEQCNIPSLAKFSVWVSFCEIYNETIYDLLQPLSKCYKRKTLRLAQDIKGCSFVKDLQWIEVADSKEAYKLLNLGKSCQSFACTKLNNASSRSHSIFTFRLLRVEDAEIPRVTKVSELSLCDLAGSERCTRTRNEGERLKESGNINTSLHILGKCIHALKNNQHAKLPQHVPFRESKLTHYLQSFFCGKGKACMIVNISQAAPVYDETLNILKFSAVAQKVLLVDTTKPPAASSSANQKSAMDVSLLIDQADHKTWSSRRRATIDWDTRLEDVIETEDDDGCTNEETEHPETDVSVTDLSVDEDSIKNDEENVVLPIAVYRKLLDSIEDLRNKLVDERKQSLCMEMKIRKEVAREFIEQLVQKDSDFSECLEHEREVLEERNDERLAIFQDLVNQCATVTEVEEIKAEPSSVVQNEDTDVHTDNFVDSVQKDLVVAKEKADEAKQHIEAMPINKEDLAVLEKTIAQITFDLCKSQELLRIKNNELEVQVIKNSVCKTQLKEAEETIAKQSLRIEELMCFANEKDTAIVQLQEMLSNWEDKVENYDKTVTSLRAEIQFLQNNGVHKPIQFCSRSDTSAGRKRPLERNPVPDDQPPAKKGTELSICNIPAEQTDIETGRSIVFDNGADMVNLQEKLDAVQSRLAALLGTLQGEKEENEKLKSELVNVTQNLLSSEEHVSRLNEEVQQMTSKCENLTSQFIIQNGINKEYEAKIDLLRTEIQSNKLNMSEKVCQIKNIQAKIDLLGKKAMGMKTMELDDSSLVSSESYTNGTLTGTSPTKERGSTFHCAIEALWNECQQVVKVSSEKSHQIQKLEEHLASLREEIKSIKLQNGQLELKLSRAAADGKVYQVTATEHLRVLVTESQSLLDVEKHRTLELSQKLLELEKKKTGYEAKVQELDDLLKSIENKNSNLEELLLQKTSAIADLQQKCLASEDMIQMLNDGENKLKGEMDEMKDKFKDLQQFLEEKENHEEKRNPETERLRKELQEFSAKEQTLKLDLEIKHEQYIDLKEKLADSKKQIQQVDKEISTMRDEKKLLCNKINEYEKIKNQMSLDLDMKRRVIQQLQKEKVDSEKMELNQKYQTELPVKDKIIEDMRLTLLEQEQTQAEQEQALEAKTKEALNLAAELEKWKHSCNVLENITLSQQNQTASEKPDVNNPLPDSLQMCQETLKEWEEKHNNERKKWNVEKIVLLNQLKEAENQRNREMRRFAEDRERHLKQQTEFELLSVQMSEKERDLQKWREERDELVAALEVQLNSLVSSNLEKDNEIEHLQGKTIQTSELAINHQVENKVSPALSLQHSCRESEMQVKSDSSIYSTIDKSEDRSDIVLDSSGLSTEDGKTSRFPKPQMEIQFTPLTPNRMEVTHQGSLSPVTVKINRPLRKRKSHEMDEDIVRSENKKNANPGRSRTPCSPSTPASNNRKAFDRKGSSLKKQISTSSTPSKKEGALQKIGDFLHSSPTIFQSKAKKLMETISSSKLTGDESCKENQSKTKRSRRKLYTTDISAPFDVPSHPIIMDKNEKESDHLIMKRRLRSKTAK